MNRPSDEPSLHRTPQAWSPTTAERLAEGLRNSDVRSSSAAVHHPSDIAVDFVYIDDADPGLRRQVAIIKHGGCLPVFIRGTEQVGAPHLVDNPLSRCDLGFRGDPRRGRWSSLRWHCGLLRWWRRGLRACDKTAYEQNCHVVSFHQHARVRRGISVTSARTAGRASTYGTANPTESGPDCGAASGIPRNRPDHGAAGRASSGTTDGAGGNGLAGGRGIPLIRWIPCPSNHRDIKQCQSCRRKEKNTGSWHFDVPRVGRRAPSEVSGDSLRVPASRGEQPRRGRRLSLRPDGSCYRSQRNTTRLRYPRTAPVLWLYLAAAGTP